MDPYLATLLSYAPVVAGAVVLAWFPLTRKLLLLPFVIALAIIGLLLASEPDLRG